MSNSWRTTNAQAAKPLPTIAADDTYAWTDITAIRPGAVLLKVTPTQVPLVITQALIDTSDSTQKGAIKLDTSSKWVTLSSMVIDAQGLMTITLGMVSGKATPTGRVVRVGTLWQPIGVIGGVALTEWYYQVSAPVSGGTGGTGGTGVGGTGN